MMERRIFLWMGLMVLFFSLGLCREASAEVQYKVKAGDTLAAVARKHDVKIQGIREANGISGSTLKVGQTLVIPTKNKKPSQIAKINKKKTPLKAEKTTPPRKAVHIVKKGETIQSIAKKAGVPAGNLRKANRLASDKLRIGQKLVLPSSPADSETLPAVAKKEKETVALLDEEEDELLDEGVPSDTFAGDIRREAEESAFLLGKWRGPEERSLFVKVAKGFLGAPYRFGGSSVRGLDCSAFVMKIYQLFDITLPRTAREQAHVGMRVNRGELQEGDLVFFNTRRAFGHVGIYIGNNQFVHAASGKKDRQVKIDSLDKPYYNQRFIKAVRLKDVANGDDNT